MTLGSCFAGIGGFDLGFERAGFDVRWQIEKDDFCRKVLAKHWPEVKRYGDITDIDAEQLEEVECIIGGFPCQDISLAGKGAGLDGDRSGLWWEMYRIIGALRPRYAVMENVPALTGRGLDAVLGSLSEIGYDAEWEIVSAAAVGAPHIRERIFIVAYAQHRGLPKRRRAKDAGRESRRPGDLRRLEQSCRIVEERKALADATCARNGVLPARSRRGGKRATNPAGGGKDEQERQNTEAPTRHHVSRHTYWQSQPQPVPLANGLPNRVGRIKGYGNAVVPQVAEYVGRLVMRHSEI